MTALFFVGSKGSLPEKACVDDAPMTRVVGMKGSHTMRVTGTYIATALLAVAAALAQPVIADDGLVTRKAASIDLDASRSITVEPHGRAEGERKAAAEAPNATPKVPGPDRREPPFRGVTIYNVGI